jgi:hypothetical protein
MFHYSFRSQLVFRCDARPAVNEIRQTDFLFLETRCGLGGCPLPPGRNRLRLCELRLGIGVILTNGARPLSISR